eukprot:scaffold33864_cov71-Phaeocystis_antarctica.AAC.2
MAAWPPRGLRVATRDVSAPGAAGTGYHIPYKATIYRTLLNPTYSPQAQAKSPPKLLLTPQPSYKEVWGALGWYRPSVGVPETFRGSVQQQIARPRDLRHPPLSYHLTVGGGSAPLPARRSPAARRPPRGRARPGCAVPAPGESWLHDFEGLTLTLTCTLELYFGVKLYSSFTRVGGLAVLLH